MIRCEHGFLRGLCVVPLCSHREPPRKGRDPRLPRACQSCGGPTTRKHCTACSNKPEVKGQYNVDKRAQRHA